MFFSRKMPSGEMCARNQRGPEAGDQKRIGPDLDAGRRLLHRPVRRPEQVEHFLGARHAGLELVQILEREALLQRNQLSVGRDARGVSGIAVGQARIVVDRLAPGSGALVGGRPHQRLDVGRGRLARHEPSAVVACAAGGEQEEEKASHGERLVLSVVGRVEIEPTSL